MKPTKLMFLLLFLPFSACMKMDPVPTEPPEPPTLTEATQSGKHTLSFMLGEEVWISDTGWGDMSSNITISSKTWRVSSKQRKLNEGVDVFGMTLTLNEWSPSSYVFSDLDKTRSSSFSFGVEQDDCFKRYETNDFDSFNKIEITHLETSQTQASEQWISGNFQFRMVEKDQGGCADTIYVTDGRFDVRYQGL